LGSPTIDAEPTHEPLNRFKAAATVTVVPVPKKLTRTSWALGFNF
jgi:hypothetical protein